MEVYATGDTAMSDVDEEAEAEGAETACNRQRNCFNGLIGSQVNQ